MSIPKYNQFMKPILQKIEGLGEVSTGKLSDYMATEFNLSNEQIKELLPSGRQTILKNRVGWVKTYLKKAKLVESKRRGFIHITERGREVLKENPVEIDLDYLSKFQEFVEFRDFSKKKDEEDKIIDSTNTTPMEQLESSYGQLREELKDELLQTIMNQSAFFFEKLVVDLLINMGYGGSKKEAGEAFSTTRDEGVDGVIKEDKLGLDLIYIQAKRWQEKNIVGSPEIQKFAGALQGKRAKKGIFITTSKFSNGAREFVEKIDFKIILIDGKRLADLMVDSNTGVAVEQKFEVKKIDSDYFSEE